MKKGKGDNMLYHEFKKRVEESHSSSSIVATQADYDFWLIEITNKAGILVRAMNCETVTSRDSLFNYLADIVARIEQCIKNKSRNDEDITLKGFNTCINDKQKLSQLDKESIESNHAWGCLLFGKIGAFAHLIGFEDEDDEKKVKNAIINVLADMVIIIREWATSL